MTEEKPTRNMKGTWNQALVTFLFPIVLVLGVRWAVVEPFVIPSGSMIPNLLIHDHILVKKFSFGVHLPWSQHWLLKWKEPERGDIIVFRYPENPQIFYIKRLVGKPGDHVLVQDGKITVNGQSFSLEKKSEPLDEAGFEYYLENNHVRTYRVRFQENADLTDSANPPQEFHVPEGNYFFMGDNRDQSSDSRLWGYVKDEYLIGKAWVVWLSCDKMLPTMTFVCDPSQIRWSRLFQSTQ